LGFGELCSYSLVLFFNFLYLDTTTQGLGLVSFSVRAVITQVRVRPLMSALEKDLQSFGNDSWRVEEVRRAVKRRREN
jgi:hypothetical protein